MRQLFVSVIVLLAIVFVIALPIFGAHWIYRFGWNICHVSKTAESSIDLVKTITCTDEPLSGNITRSYFECDKFQLDVPNIDFECVAIKQCSSDPIDLNRECHYLCSINGTMIGTAQSDIQCFGRDAYEIVKLNPVNVTWKGFDILQDGYHIPLGVYGNGPSGKPFLYVDPNFNFWHHTKLYLVALCTAIISALLRVAFDERLQQLAT